MRPGPGGIRGVIANRPALRLAAEATNRLPVSEGVCCVPAIALWFGSPLRSHDQACVQQEVLASASQIEAV